MKVIHLPVGEAPVLVEVEQPALAPLQELVGGYLEAIATLAPGLVLMGDEEAQLYNRPRRVLDVPGHLFTIHAWGPLVLTRHDHEGTTVDVTDDDMALVHRIRELGRDD